MLELARRVGIDVPANRLVDIAQIKGLPEEAHTGRSNALAVQRFDRAPRVIPFTWRILRKSSGSFPMKSTDVAAMPTLPPSSGLKPEKKPLTSLSTGSFSR